MWSYLEFSENVVYAKSSTKGLGFAVNSVTVQGAGAVPHRLSCHHAGKFEGQAAFTLGLPGFGVPQVGMPSAASTGILLMGDAATSSGAVRAAATTGHHVQTSSRAGGAGGSDTAADDALEPAAVPGPSGGKAGPGRGAFEVFQEGRQSGAEPGVSAQRALQDDLPEQSPTKPRRPEELHVSPDPEIPTIMGMLGAEADLYLYKNGAAGNDYDIEPEPCITGVEAMLCGEEPVVDVSQNLLGEVPSHVQ